MLSTKVAVAVARFTIVDAWASVVVVSATPLVTVVVVSPEVTVTPTVVVMRAVFVTLASVERCKMEEHSLLAFGVKISKSLSANWTAGLLHDSWFGFA